MGFLRGQKLNDPQLALPRFIFTQSLKYSREALKIQLERFPELAKEYNSSVLIKHRQRPRITELVNNLLDQEIYPKGGGK